MSRSLPALSFRQKALAHWSKEKEDKLTAGRVWPLLPSEAPELLRVLGLLNADGSMSADSIRKFSQVNHIVTLLLPTLNELKSRHQIIRICDAGCGTSALTLIFAWLLKVKWGHECRLIGLDSNPNVIATSRKRAEALGLDQVLKFEHANLDPLLMEGLFGRIFPDDVHEKRELRPHLLLALHACDTATDKAFAMGIVAQADAMAVAPCCHAELAKIWKNQRDPNDPLAPVFSSPNLRRETAAQLTDALRMVYVRSRGYEVTATEFVPSSHTPKNRLLLALRRGRYHEPSKEQYENLKKLTHGLDLALEQSLSDWESRQGVSLMVE